MAATHHRHHQGHRRPMVEGIHHCPHNHRRHKCHTTNLFACNYALSVSAESNFLQRIHFVAFLEFPVLYPVRCHAHHGLNTRTTQAIIWVRTVEQTKSKRVDPLTSQPGLCRVSLLQLIQDMGKVNALQLA